MFPGWVGGWGGWLETDNRAISVQLNSARTATGTELGKSHQIFKDWVTIITKDIKKMNIDKTFQEIKKMKKNEFKRMVAQKIQNWELEKLEETPQ